MAVPATIDKSKRIEKWYFGGCASAMAACCTHPLDLLKVQLQTQQKEKVPVIRIVGNILKSDGVLGMYNGLSASVCRQLTYSMTRFAMYGIIKRHLTKDGKEFPFYKKVTTAAVSGAVGGLVGTPADLVNVRMQNDVKLPIPQRRNYKHAIDGLYRVGREEGVTRMFSGASMASSRAVMVSVGQLACYDQIKSLLMNTGYFQDNLVTHFTCSTMAGTIATLLTMPLDVMKTRMMNAAPGQYKDSGKRNSQIKAYIHYLATCMDVHSSLLWTVVPGQQRVEADLLHNLAACALDIAKNGPLGFFKGFVPAFVRLGPHTIFTFVFLEQIRLNFGVDPPQS